MQETALFICPTPTLAGAESTLKKLAKESKKRGNKVLIVFLSRSNNAQWTEFTDDELLFLGGNSETIGLLKFAGLLVVWSLTLRRFDSVFTSHIHTNGFVGLMRKLRLLRSSNAIYRESTIPFYWYKGLRLLTFKLYYRLYGRPDVIICQTREMKNELIKNVPHLDSSTMSVIPNCIDIESVRGKANVHLCNEFSNDEIVAVGRLVKEKSFDVLLKAFAQVCVENETIKLRIIGSGSEQADLAQLCSHLKIKQRVIFEGFVENPFPFMSSASLCVVSSQIEGFPNTLLEMMTVGKRVVSTRCADGIEKLPGIFTCNTNDADDLAQALRQALNQNKEDVKNNVRLMREYINNHDVSNYYERIFKHVK